MQGPISKWADRRANQDPFKGPTDCEAAAQAHINVLAGAALALGIKYAGTASAAASDLLHHYVMYLMTSKQAAPDPVSGARTLCTLCMRTRARPVRPTRMPAGVAHAAAAGLLHLYSLYLMPSTQASPDPVLQRPGRCTPEAASGPGRGIGTEAVRRCAHTRTRAFTQPPTDYPGAPHVHAHAHLHGCTHTHMVPDRRGSGWGGRLGKKPLCLGLVLPSASVKLLLHNT